MNNANDRLDYLIGLAMLDCAADEVAEFEAIDDSGVAIDGSLDRRIYRLINRKEREFKARKIKKISFRVAVAAMLIMSIMLLSMLLISGVREAIWNAIVKWYDDYVAIVFVQRELEATDLQNTDSFFGVSATDKVSDGEKVDDVLEASPPTEILEYKKPVVSNVYTEVELAKNDGYYMIEYYKGETNKFIYWQKIYTDKELFFDNIEMNAKEISINAYSGMLVLNGEEEPNSITWTDGEYLYTIDGNLSESELIELAETVK